MATSIFKLVGSIFVENTDANKNIEETGKKAETTGSKLAGAVGKAAKFGAGVALAAGSAATALYGVANSAAESLDAIQKGAQQLDMSYESYQTLNYALERSGASIDDLSKGMKNITNVMTGMVDEDNKASEALEALGISIENTDGTMKSSEDVMKEALLALADMEDTTQRNAQANAIFGTSYQDLLPLLNQGSEGIEDLMQNAKDLGLVMSDEAVDGGAAFKDQLDDVKDSISAMVTKIGEKFMPAIQSILKWVTDHMPDIQTTVSEVFDYIDKFFNDIQPLLVELKDLIVDVVWPAIKAIIDSGILTFALEKVTDSIKGITKALKVMSGVFKLIAGDWEGGWDALKDNIGGAFDFLMTKINPVYALVKNIKSMMEWIMGADIDGKVGEITESNSAFAFATPKMATGGIIASAGTAIVGEAGAELIEMPRGAKVTPLNDNNNAFADMSSKLDTLISVMQNFGQMGVYINGEALVGEIAGQMDTTLGSYARRAGRGV